MTQESTPLVPVNHRPQATTGLILLPYAGGSPRSYQLLVKELPEHVAAWGVCLPGRERRISDQPFTDIMEVAREVAEASTDICTAMPTVLFGHSMGGLCAYETALLLQDAGTPAAGLAISSTAAPHSGLLPDATACLLNEAIRGLRSFNELEPWESLGADQAKYVLAPFFADMAMLLRYERQVPSLVRLPIWASTGSDDPLVPPSALDAWKEVSRYEMGTRIHAGGHFYIEEAARNSLGDFFGTLLARRPPHRPQDSVTTTLRPIATL